MLWLIIAVLVALSLFLVFRMKALQTEMSDFRKSDSTRSTFIKALAREIRTPLNSVSKLAEIISKEGLYLSKSEKKTISDQILFNARIISTLLDEVNICSDNVSNGHQLEDERFSPYKLCQTCIDANFSSVKEGVRLSFVYSSGEDLFVSTDRHIVELVLNKLVVCACKFTLKGEIGVGCEFEKDSHRLTFFVQDTGVGIPENRKKSLFKWFDEPDSIDGETEFDLSVSQRLASKIGGYLRLDESYKEGTRMEFTLPVR